LIKGIFWDNDGVLVDTEQFYYLATKEILATVDIPLTKQNYLQLFLREARGAWHLAEQKGIPLHEIDRLKEQRNALYGRLLLDQDLMIDGADEVLHSLYGKYKMAMVTSSRKEHLQVVHQSTGFLKYFDFVLAHGDYTKYKPDPEPYLLALEKSKLEANECFVVEDSERGLISATRAGLKCVIVPTDLTQEGDFSAAYRVLKSIREVPSLLASLRQ
jgi:HAD superfamily hydrolase (TIGR01509 family)